MNGIDRHIPNHGVSCDWDGGTDHLEDVLHILNDAQNACNAHHDSVRGDIGDERMGHCASTLCCDWNDAIASWFQYVQYAQYDANGVMHWN